MAKTILNIAYLRDPLVRKLSDRGRALDRETIFSVFRRGKFGIAHRAITNAGQMDLATYFMTLWWRGAVISIDNYNAKRVKIEHRDQRKLSSDGKVWGPIIGLKSNKDSYAFSVTVKNCAILRNGKLGEVIGEPRTYMITDDRGRILPNKVTVAPFGKEKYFFGEGVTDLSFDSLVHPNRWQSVFGAPHIIRKIFEERVIGDLKIFRPIEVGRKKDDSKKKELTEKLSVDSLKTFFASGSFFSRDTPVKPAVDVDELADFFLPMSRFATRANELAYFNNGWEKNQIPHWIDTEFFLSTFSRKVRVLYLGDRCMTLRFEESVSETEIVVR